MKVTFNDKSLDLTTPKIMGILNLTPNSFSDGGDFYDQKAALDRAYQMIEEGADIIDIGAESTNPKATPITSDEEISRLLPVVRTLREKLSIPLSVDTFRAETIRVMLAEGVDIINDVTALGDHDSLHHLANSKAAVVLMHMLGGPHKMHLKGDYRAEGGITRSVTTHLLKRAEYCLAAGITPERIILDPGFGFDKSNTDQLTLLKELTHLTALSYPLLIGLSRKRLIGTITQVEIAKKRCSGSVAAALWGINAGAKIVRVHDVKATKEALMMWQAIKDAPST